jgi:hypothetical protein
MAAGLNIKTQHHGVESKLKASLKTSLRILQRSLRLTASRRLRREDRVMSELSVIRTKLRSSLIRRSRIPVWPQNQIWGSWVHLLVQSLS